MTITIDLINIDSSEKVARLVASCLTSPLLMTFCGEIGAGKTSFIRAMLRALGVNTVIKSPSFSLVETYQTADFLIHHFDLYRIQDENELELLGFRDYLCSEAICCVEWPQHAPHYLAAPDLCFTLELKEPGRLMHVDAMTAKATPILACLKGTL
jgi:tRNA threonylcarbamoyladenosine biosynthesis protein TsaE